MSNAAKLLSGHQMGQGADDGVGDHPCQHPAGASLEQTSLPIVNSVGPLI